MLVASVIGAVGLLSLPWYGEESATSQVDWVNADETNPWPTGTSESESPSYDGDGTADDPSDGEGSDEDGGDGSSGEGASPSSGPIGGSGNDAGGVLGLSFPVQAAMSVGLLALAFLALLPGRRMPADLR